MKVFVTKSFDGAPDGTIYPKHFVPGDIVEGDLARVAVEQGWATEDVEPAAPGQIEIPADWQGFNAAESVALARSLGADEIVRTKAAAVAFIATEVETRAARAQV